MGKETPIRAAIGPKLITSITNIVKNTNGNIKLTIKIGNFCYKIFKSIEIIFYNF